MEILYKISLIEWFGVCFSVVQVLLAQRNNINNYLFGIAGTILTLYVMFTSKLYAEFTLNMYYLIMSIYGWFYWKFGTQKQETPITKSTNHELFKAIVIIILSFSVFYYSLIHFTNSDVPFVDALIAAFAWAGMWLMAKRKLENWLFLNVSNIISIPLMLHKQLYLYAILSIILFVVAIFGYIHWKNILKKSRS